MEKMENLLNKDLEINTNSMAPEVVKQTKMEQIEIEEKKPLNKNDDLVESMLQYVGDFGLYQKVLVMMMLPIGVCFAFVYFGQMFIAATPQSHWCRVPELEHLDQQLRRNLSAPPGDDEWQWDRCRTYDTNWTKVLETMKPPPPNTPLVSCQHGWEFILEDIPYPTIVSERGWVCEYAANVPFAQSLFFVGSIMGGLLFGWLADLYGRVPGFVITNMIACVGGLLGLLTSGLWDFALSRFIVGMSFDNCFYLFYIIVFEYVGPKYRTMASNLSIALFFSGGCLVLPWMAIWIGNWRTLLFVTSVPMTFALLTPLFVPESVRWLLSKGKIHQAAETLRKFERINGNKIPKRAMHNFILTAGNIRKNESIVGVLKSREMRLMLGLFVCVYMASAVVFDGLVRMSENLGYNLFVAFTLTSATEIPAMLIIAFVMDRFGRKKFTIVPLAISGVTCFLMAFIPMGTLRLLLALVARFFINMSFSATGQWTTEALPTPVRASGSALVHVSGYAGTVLTPYIVYSQRLWSPLPMLILSMVALLAGALTMSLPETMGRPLPQTIADSERMFNAHSTVCGSPESDPDDKKEEYRPVGLNA